MLQVNSLHKLGDMEAVFRHVAQQHGVHILAVSHLGPLLREKGLRTTEDAVVFTLCHTDLAAALLTADIRFAAFVPCRVAAWSRGEGVTLETLSPREYCRLLGRPDLDRLAANLETSLREIMEHAASPASLVARAPAVSPSAHVGAVEGQVNVRGSIPQRIDCRGSKIEDMAGTGEHDSAGG